MGFFNTDSAHLNKVPTCALIIFFSPLFLNYTVIGSIEFHPNLNLKKGTGSTPAELSFVSSGSKRQLGQNNVEKMLETQRVRCF